MATRAIAATGEKVVNNETYVSWNGATNVQVYLPNINDGSGSTVAVDTEIRFETTGAGMIEVLTLAGVRVGYVPGRAQAVAIAQSGTVQSESDRWHFSEMRQTPVALAAQITQTATASYTATEQAMLNALKASLNAALTCLIDNGLMKAE